MDVSLQKSGANISTDEKLEQLIDAPLENEAEDSRNLVNANAPQPSNVSSHDRHNKDDTTVSRVEPTQQFEADTPVLEVTTSLTFSQEEAMMNVGYPENFQGRHEEADSLLAFRLSSVRGNAMIRASDIDVLLTVIGMIGRHLMSPRSYGQIIMDCGSGNDRQHRNVSSIVTALEEKQNGLAAAIPGLHTFTGCDFTTAFYRKGKTKPLEILEKDAGGTYVKFFSSLAFEEEPDHKVAQAFVSLLYGVNSSGDVNDARYTKLRQITGKLNENKPLENVKKVDCALPPPCANTLQKKTKRAHFTCILWEKAGTAHPGEGLDPPDFGWTEKDGCYIPDWLSGPTMLKAVTNMPLGLYCHFKVKDRRITSYEREPLTSFKYLPSWAPFK